MHDCIFFSLRWQMSIYLNVLFEAFMDAWETFENVFSYRTHTINKTGDNVSISPTQQLIWTDSLIFIFIWTTNGHAFLVGSLEWNKMSEMMCCLQLLQHSIFILRQDFIQYCKVLDCGKRETGLGEAVRIVSL